MSQKNKARTKFLHQISTAHLSFHTLLPLKIRSAHSATYAKGLSGSAWFESSIEKIAPHIM